MEATLPLDICMPVSYKKLWVKLVENEISKGELAKMISTSPATISKMARGDNVTVDTILRICAVLKCQPGDIMEYLPDDGTKSTTKQDTPEVHQKS